MDAKAAWEYLGISERMLNKYASEGRLTFEKKPKAGGGFTRDFDEAELQEFKRTMGGSRPRATAGNGQNGDHSAQQYALGKVQSVQGAEWLTELMLKTSAAASAQTVELLRTQGVLSPTVTGDFPAAITGAVPESVSGAAAVRRAGGGVPTSERLVLTLVEASELSGIPRAKLRTAIGDGSLVGHLDTLGRGWRVKRADLERWVEGL